MTPSIIQAPAPPVPAWLDGVIDPSFQVQFKGPGGVVSWESNVGPQTWAALCPFGEMLVGGRRGGGKSKFLIAKPAMGDLSLPKDDPAHYSFLNDRDFRGIFLREEYQSMSEFVEESIEFYRPFGGKPKGDPRYIDFESKARIYFNHLNDEDSFSKYKGWNVTFIGIEELTQIKTLRRYLKLLGSLRSVDRMRNGRRFPPLRTQIVSTTNPDGPGATWVKQRFVEVPDERGNVIPWNTPMTDPITEGIRIFIPFPIEANPYLGEGTAAGRSYRTRLLAQDEVTRKQWMEGDWNAATGQYFTEFRPQGPIGTEKTTYPWANHVIKSSQLRPYWIRWGSGDWGFSHPAAFHKFCRNENDKRVHVYEELQVRQMGSFEVGVLLGKWWQPELLAMKAARVEPCVTIYIGADAFSKGDSSKTKAEQMEAGIKEVLGPYGSLLLKYDETEKEAMLRDKKRAVAMFENRKLELSGHIRIALQPTYFDRVSAWDYVRDWIRFRPSGLPLQSEDEREQFLRDVLAQEGMESYEMHAAELRNAKPETLPKVQIWENCAELIRCIKVAQRDTSNDDNPAKISKREDVQKFNADENGNNGDDALESFRNGAVAYKDIESTIPKGFWVAERMDDFQGKHKESFGEQLTDPTRLAMVMARQSVLYDKVVPQQGGGALNMPRRSSIRHRIQ